MLFLSCLVLRLCIHRFHQLSGCGFPVPTFQDKLFCIWFFCPLLDVLGMIVCCVHFSAFCALHCSPPVETGFLASAAFTHCAFCVSLYGVCFLLYTFPPPMLFFLLFCALFCIHLSTCQGRLSHWCRRQEPFLLNKNKRKRPRFSFVKKNVCIFSIFTAFAFDCTWFSSGKLLKYTLTNYRW